MEEDMVASHFYYDQEDYFLLPVDILENTLFRRVRFEFIESINEGRCQAWNIQVIFRDGTSERLHHDYLCPVDRIRGILSADSITLTTHNSPRAGIFFENSSRQMYYIVSKESPHFPDLISTTHVQELIKENYRQMAISNETRWAEQTFDRRIHFDFIREKRGSDCRIWFVAIYGGDHNDYISFEFACKSSEARYDVVLLCKALYGGDHKEVGVLYDSRENQVYYISHKQGCQ